MFKVVSVVDKEGTALDRLAKMVIPYHDNLDYHVVAVHPKRPSTEQLNEFEALAKSADLIDFQYFKTAEMLCEKFDWLQDKIKTLAHNNPYSIYDSDWSRYHLSAANKSITENLRKHTGREVRHIPLTVDTGFWTYNQDWQPNKRIIMVANRIESKKGILPVAVACGNLGLTLVLVGQISDPNYFHSILQAGPIEFHEQVSDEKLKQLYYTSAVHVCNSVDNFESGTLPLLEAMLCGTPVLTRMVGHVADLYNEENLIIQPDGPEAVETIQAQLEEMLGDPKNLQVMRDKAWNSAKVYSAERRAYAYQVFWRSLLPGKSVSVVVPIYDKPDIIRKCLESVASQDYPNLELVVADDNYQNPNFDLVNEFRRYVNFPVRYLWTATGDYGLARARNEAAIEATGEILVFCDQRQIMAPSAVRSFVDNLVPNKWLWGEKGGVKKDWIENFSAVYRSDFLRFGGFNERMKWYGGLSQESRHRLKLIGMRTEYCAEAKAEPAGKSSNRNRKRADIIKSKNRLWKMEF